MNKVLFSGFLGSAPQTKSLPSGDDVTEFSVAVKDGKETIWYSCSDFRKSKKIYEHFAFSQGDPSRGIEVSGRMRPARAFTRKDGSLGASLEVIVESVDFPPIRKGEAGQATAAPASGNAVAVDDGDESTPF